MTKASLYITALLPCVALMALAGCKQNTGNPSLNIQYAPRINSEEIRYDMRFNDRNDLTALQVKTHEAFLRSLGLRYGDRILIDDPEPDGAKERRAVVAALLARFGLIPENESVVTSGFIAPNAIRLVVRRAKASVNNCPSWSDSVSINRGMNMMNNTGCATASNLAAMVADPNDLTDGRSYKGSEAQSIVKAVKAYHDTPAAQSGDLKGTAPSTKGD